ncbi:MAG: PTS sugar transporter subunit IIA [Deltaproteobacteria bacterium]|nr:PTS sugar transporter subunit IIA [Deltaproteobacteria bacterium]
MQIADFLSEQVVIPVLAGQTKVGVLQELADSAAAKNLEIDSQGLLSSLQERERLGSTAIGEGIAIPHARLPGVSKFAAVFGRHPQGVDFESLDGQPTRLFFLLVVPQESTGEHLKVLARVSRLMKDAGLRNSLMQAHDRSEIYRRLIEHDSKS